MNAPAHMARALRLAERGRTTTFPNPRVGCVIVREGRVVGEGWHECAGEPHAEVHALRAAGERARGAEVFVTLEPCAHHGRTPPCVDALIAAGVGKVWAAMTDPDPRVAGQGLQKLREAGIDVETGLLQAPAAELNRGFVSRITRGRPWTTLKLAMSMDGRTAMASGESKWISGDVARADVHRLRAEAGAVLSSSESVLADDPLLTVRLPGFERQPDRIVLDSLARVPETAKVWAAGARRIWLTAARGAAPAGVERLTVENVDGGHLSLPAALATLGKAGINQLLIECGPGLAGALLQAGLVDELVIYMAPSLLGARARPLALLPGLEHLDQRLQLEIRDVTKVGADIKIIAIPVPSPSGRGSG